jgi:tyrosyl-tRNA synthetase
MVQSALLRDLHDRGLIAQITEAGALDARLAEGPATLYCGFDPTADSLHLGHLVPVLLLRRFQQAGHTPIALVGGATGMIGDPSFKATERKLNTPEVVAGWSAKIREQLAPFLDFEGGNAAIMANNHDWFGAMGALEFLRDIGKHFSVSRMLAREVVKSRLEEGISYTEFSYVLLQSYDYLVLHQKYGVTLQTGGSDQFGNITAGVDLVRRVTGHHVHALATPLITKADGEKYGKTAGGAIWLDPTMCSPYRFHQFFLNAEDEMVVSYVKAFTTRPPEEIEELDRLTREEPHQRAAQRVLADDLTDLVHSPEERIKVTKAAQAIFGRDDLHSLDAATLAGVAQEVPQAEVPTVEGVTVVDAFVATGVTKSKGEARRAIQEGGAYLNNNRVTDVNATLTSADLLAGGHAVLRRGKKTVGLVHVSV